MSLPESSRPTRPPDGDGRSAPSGIPASGADAEVESAFAAIDLQLREFNYYYSEWNAAPAGLTTWLDGSQEQLRKAWESLSLAGVGRLLVRLLSERSRYSKAALRHVCLALAEGGHGGRLAELPPGVLDEVMGVVSDGSAFKLPTATTEAWLASGNPRLVGLAMSQFASNPALFESLPTVERLLQAGEAGERLPEVYPVGPLLERHPALRGSVAYRRFIARLAGSAELAEYREIALAVQVLLMDEDELAKWVQAESGRVPGPATAPPADVAGAVPGGADPDAGGARRVALIGGLVQRGRGEEAARMLVGSLARGEVDLVRRVIRDLGAAVPEPVFLPVFGPLLTARSPVLCDLVAVLRRRGMVSGLPRLREVAAELDQLSRQVDGAAGRRLVKGFLLTGVSLSVLGVFGMAILPFRVVVGAGLALWGLIYVTTEDCLGRSAPRGWGEVERAVRELSGDSGARVYSLRWWEKPLRLRQWRRLWGEPARKPGAPQGQRNGESQRKPAENGSR